MLTGKHTGREFQVTAWSSDYLIENGKIIYPVK